MHLKPVSLSVAPPSPLPSSFLADVAFSRHGSALQVSLLFDGDGQWYRGQVLGHDRRKGRHLILYDDGEDEWVVLDQETVAFHQELSGGPTSTGIYPGIVKGGWGGLCSCGREEPCWPASGLRVGCVCVSGWETSPCTAGCLCRTPAAGMLAPAGEAAVGWRVSVYWTHDMVFYSGELVGYDASTHRFEVSYDDGEENTISLASDRLKFVLPPGHRGGRFSVVATGAVMPGLPGLSHPTLSLTLTPPHWRHPIFPILPRCSFVHSSHPAGTEGLFSYSSHRGGGCWHVLLVSPQWTLSGWSMQACWACHGGGWGMNPTPTMSLSSSARARLCGGLAAAAQQAATRGCTPGMWGQMARSQRPAASWAAAAASASSASCLAAGR